MRHVLRRTAVLSPTRCRWLLEGLLAAGLGLGALAALVLLLWTLSPHPDGGADEALAIAADLWLLAHGTELLRTGTLDGPPAPIGLTPLLLTALPGWLLHRAVRAADWEPEPVRAAEAALWISGGYLLAGAVALGHTQRFAISGQPLSAAVHVPAFALAVTLVSAWAVSGPPGGRLVARLPRLPRRAFDGRRLRAAARVAAAGVAACCGAGALLALGGLVAGAGAAQDTLGQLSGDWSGRLAVLLLTLTLVPNAAVWGAAYGLGPGFTLGAGSAVGPLAVAGEPKLPPFPLLADLPAGTPGNPFLWTAVALVPAAAVLVTARYAAHAAVPVRGERATASGWAGTALTALLAALATGAALTLLAALAGGPLGTGALASFGPDHWLTGAAAAAWTAALGTPLALVLRALRLRRPRSAVPAPVPAPQPRRAPAPNRRRRARRRPDPADAWHTTAARRTRWAALKKTSGTLFPELPGERREHEDAPGGPR
ncbi:cell division protein PerM [Streptomyces litchfieldiae]|uniref:DUF6350 family protein n=1 Tax=Streptomyces litchfieldiae TaxID=3075543 RepID=A0ABU2N174_9ACTN|nr:DUF6350 family protein [Streptomyces sp. DSM 44938]MDT0347263.1 DUF6350 family protein [Streptomyces sp. DSM 44938]